MTERKPVLIIHRASAEYDDYVAWMDAVGATALIFPRYAQWITEKQEITILEYLPEGCTDREKVRHCARWRTHLGIQYNEQD